MIDFTVLDLSPKELSHFHAQVTWFILIVHILHLQPLSLEL